MSFGGWAISEDLYAWMCEHVPEGATVLELGSGDGSAELVKRWEVHSIEHDEQWVGRVEGVHYTYAPLTFNWYALAAVERAIEGCHWQCRHLHQLCMIDTSPPSCNLCGDVAVQYHALLIDGPPQALGRGNFLKHWTMFDTSVPWIFDDIQKWSTLKWVAKVASSRGQKLQEYRCNDGKAFGVIAARNGMSP